MGRVSLFTHARMGAKVNYPTVLLICYGTLLGEGGHARDPCIFPRLPPRSFVCSGQQEYRGGWHPCTSSAIYIRILGVRVHVLCNTAPDRFFLVNFPLRVNTPPSCKHPMFPGLDGGGGRNFWREGSTFLSWGKNLARRMTPGLGEKKAGF